MSLANFDWSIYKGNLEWLPSRTIFLTKHGSHAYGTNIATSDLDLRGIAIAPREYYTGFLKTFNQANQSEPDLTIFELKKFMALAAECNPNVLELLYTDPSDHLIMTPLAERLIEKRDSFLSRKVVHTFSGYATSQLRRINLHYRYLTKGEPVPPTREEFGLPERTVIPADQLAAANAAIRKQIDTWNWHDLEELEPALRQSVKDEFFRRLTELTAWSWDQMDGKVWEAAAVKLGFNTNFIELLDLERRYSARLKEYQNFKEWEKNRNPARAELEAKFGYDTKHALHLVRLLRMCREILVEGVVRVRRPDAAELLEIRAGAWSYHQLIEWAEKQDAELKELAKTSKLPQSADRVALHDLCCALVEESFASNLSHLSCS